MEAPGIEPVRRGRGRPKTSTYVLARRDSDHFDPSQNGADSEVTSKVTCNDSAQDPGSLVGWAREVAANLVAFDSADDYLARLAREGYE